MTTEKERLERKSNMMEQPIEDQLGTDEMVMLMVAGETLVNDNGNICFYDPSYTMPFRFLSSEYKDSDANEHSEILNGWFGAWKVLKDPVYVPHTLSSIATSNLVVVNKNSGHYLTILHIHNKGVELVNNGVSYEKLLENYVNIDGTPCGKVQDES